MTPGDAFPFFARTTRGLEDVTAEELRTLRGVAVGAVGHRLVAGSACGAATQLAGLRTADDVFVEVGEVDGMERARAALALLTERAAALDLRPALARIRALRPLPEQPATYVRASFVGRRNYRTSEIEDAVAGPLLARHGLRRAADDGAAALHLRLVLEGARLRLGLRLAAAPLHERAFQRVHRPGGLKPPVAAALWRLVALRPGQRALDPCCGAGTLLAEADAAGARALGGDAEPDALRASAENLRSLSRPAALVRWDGRRLPLRAACVDAAASNLPWGRQVGSLGPLAALHDGIVRELSRVLVPGARAALLTGSPELLPAGVLPEAGRREIGLYGQRPTLVVLAQPDRAA